VSIGRAIGVQAASSTQHRSSTRRTLTGLQQLLLLVAPHAVRTADAGTSAAAYNSLLVLVLVLADSWRSVLTQRGTYAQRKLRSATASCWTSLARPACTQYTDYTLPVPGRRRAVEPWQRSPAPRHVAIFGYSQPQLDPIQPPYLSTNTPPAMPLLFVLLPSNSCAELADSDYYGSVPSSSRPYTKTTHRSWLI